MRPCRAFLLFVLVLSFGGPEASRAQQRRSLGADSLFGPGIVDVSPNGSAAKLRLVRPGHVAAYALKDHALPQLVLPRRSESRLSRTGDQWIDLPWPVTGGPATTTFTVAASGGGGRLPRAGRSGAAAAPDAGLPSGPGTVLLVLVGDSAWNRDSLLARLPQEFPENPMVIARTIAAALMGARADTCAAYLVRW